MYPTTNTSPSRIVIAVAMCVLAHATTIAVAQDPVGVQIQRADAKQAEETSTLKSADGKIRFSFEGAPWRDVIKKLADTSDLALHFGDLPRGSFTYTDTRSFTPQEALDRINLFLLPEGFTLVRSGKLMSVINLGDPRSLKQLDSLAKMITVDQLNEQLNHDVVKCIFPLGELEAEDAIDELSALNLITTPALFKRTNRIMVTETAGKLKNVKTILDAFQPDAMENGTVVKNFALQHVDAEDILVVARPHMGLATGEMIGIDVSLSSDLQGENIFVTGVEDKVKLIEGLIKSLDVPAKGTTTNGDLKLQTHNVTGNNIETVYNVLQTLLAEKSVRLSMDAEAGTIVALASPETQTEIAATVAQLQASEADFEVIPLKTIDPYFAINLLEEMLDLPDIFTPAEDIDPDAPKIDADPGNMRLFVRGKKHQIEQIKKIVAGLDSTTVGGAANSDETVRIFPLKGKRAEQVLVTAGRFWRGKNPIVLFPSTVDEKSQSSERVVGESSETDDFDSMFEKESPTPNVRMLSSHVGNDAPAIRCQVTPRGILLQSEDSKALDQFESHLRSISGPLESTPSAPVVFYLKYAKPDDAIKMLAELLDGGEAAKEGEAGSLVNGFSSSGDFSFGSLISSSSGATTLTSGTITVVADSRLNRLIAQGTTSDIELVEGYLKIVDKDTSITSIQTYGSSQIIELRHTLATEVASVIREAYGSRISGGSTGTPTASTKTSAKPAPKTPAKPPKTSSKPTDKKSEKPAAGNQPVKNLEPKMTIAVHEPSNSLIVTAPPQLYREVEQLARAIDSRSEKSVKILTLPKSGTMESQLIQQIFGDRVRTTSGSSPQTSSSTKSKSKK